MELSIKVYFLCNMRKKRTLFDKAYDENLD